MTHSFINFALNIIVPFQKEKFINTILVTPTRNAIMETFQYATLGFF